MLGRPDCWRAFGEDEIHLEADVFSRQRGKALILPLRRAVLQGDTLALHIPEIAEPLAEDLIEGGGGVRVKGARQNPDPRHLRHRLRVGGVWRQEEAEGESDAERHRTEPHDRLLTSVPACRAPGACGRPENVCLRQPNAAPQPLPEAGAQRTLEAVGCRRLFGPRDGQDAVSPLGNPCMLAPPTHAKVTR